MRQVLLAIAFTAIKKHRNTVKANLQLNLLTTTGFNIAGDTKLHAAS